MKPKKKPAPKSRIIKTIIQGDREWQLHATKGWRSYRISERKAP